MKQFLEIEIERGAGYRTPTEKIVININHIVLLTNSGLIVTAIHPVAHGTGQIHYDLSKDEAARIRGILLDGE